MEFTLTPEQETLARTLRAFAQKELAPRSATWDATGEFPRDAWRQMGELGLFGLRVPVRWGGSDSDYLTMGIAAEEIGRGDFSATYGIQLAGLAGEIMGRHASEALQARWLPRVVTGESVAALGLTEPGVGSDAAQLACRAVRTRDGWSITGEKSGISLAMAADIAIVFARTGGEGSGARGVSTFLVPLDLPGVARSPLKDLGSRCVGRAVLAFDDVRLPADHLLGAEGTGFHQVMRGFDYNRVLIGLAAIGAATASLEETMAYVKERRAFGQPLARWEGVAFPIAEAATHLEAARLLCYRALWLADRGERHSKEAAMVKWWTPRLAVDTIHQCLLLHGHYGYTEELPFGQRMRDVIGLEIGDGAAQIMKIVITRELMGREFLPY